MEHLTTKKALASALKECMDTKPFEKISIHDICDPCHLNRKSFYYHFKDKYDLVNWIFDSEFLSTAYEQDYEDLNDAFLYLATYFYHNQSFYRKAFLVEGQNSFVYHFHELLLPFISSQLKDIISKDSENEFQIHFFADTIVMAYYRWIVSESMLSPEEFIHQMQLSAQYIAMYFKNLNTDF